MPAELDSCVEKVMAEGHDESSAYAICNSSLYGSSPMRKIGFDGQMSEQTMEMEGVTLSPEQVSALVEAAFNDDIEGVKRLLSQIVNIEEEEAPAGPPFAE